MNDGLIIEDGGFQLVQVELGSPFWDVKFRKKVKHNDGSESIEWKNRAYGVTIEFAINMIILTRLRAKHPEVLSLKEFFDEYKKERASVVESFSLTTINLAKDLINLQKQLSNEGNKKEATV